MSFVQLRMTVVGFVIGMAFAVGGAACSGNKGCDATSCATGCCTAAGACLGGTDAAACGTGGAECVACGVGSQCRDSACVALVPGGDGGADGGTDAGTDGGSGGPFATAAEYDAARIDALCAKAVACGAFATVDGCRQVGLYAGDPAAAAALKDGRATFDGTSARACVDAIAGLGCDDVAGPSGISACAAAVKGAVANGAMCFADLECGAGSYCSADSQTCPGTCEAKKAEGETASFDRECLPGMYVDLDGTCAKLVAVGQSCAGASSFDPPKLCVPEAYCDSNFTCTKRGTLGDGCETSNACLAAWVCREGKCAKYAAGGEGCAVVPPVPCQLDLTCNATAYDQPGTCGAAIADGGTCFESSQCASGLFCRGMPTPDHCAPPEALGAACQPYVEGECADDQFCDSTAQVCTKRLALGEACTDPQSCPHGAFCDTTCKLPSCVDPTP